MDSGKSKYQKDDTGYPNSCHIESLELPPNLLTYPNQVDGHGVLGNKPAFLFSKTGKIVYKPVQKFPKGLHEVSFYTYIYDASCTDDVIIELRKFIPTYIGLFHEVKTRRLFFGMKDLLAAFEKPAVCDIKLGRQTYTPDSGPAKIEIERQKYQCQDQLGFGLNAIKLSSSSDGRPVHLNRAYCRLLTPDTVYADGIFLFLSSAGRHRHLVSQLATAFLAQLGEFIDWFDRQNRFTFYASSLLLAYDSPPVNGVVGNEAGLSSDQVRTSVNLIDFTRWRHQPVASQRDYNVLYGLRCLADFLRQAEASVAEP